MGTFSLNANGSSMRMKNLDKCDDVTISVSTKTLGKLKFV